MLPISLEGRVPPLIEACHEPVNLVSLFSLMFRHKVEVWFVAEDGGAFLVVALHVAQESTVPKWIRMIGWSSFQACSM